MRGGELGFILVVLLVVSGCGVSASSPVEKMSAKNSEALADGVDATKNPEATFKGCWHKSGKNQYQAVDVSVKNSGKYAFNAVLYYGTGCGAGDFADQFGFGQIISFGGFEDTFGLRLLLIRRICRRCGMWVRISRSALIMRLLGSVEGAR